MTHPPINCEPLKSLIRTIPNFPKPGILFYDITTLLKDKNGYATLVDALAAHYIGMENVDLVLGIEAGRATLVTRRIEDAGAAEIGRDVEAWKLRVGPVVAARIIADVGDVARFADRNRFASWTGTAPLDASSGEQIRHRLSRAGNRRMNHMIHIAAVTQLRLDTDGRAYYRRKRAAGKRHNAALICLERRRVDVVEPGNPALQ